jgi:hypothetical protein
MGKLFRTVPSTVCRHCPDVLHRWRQSVHEEDCATNGRSAAELLSGEQHQNSGNLNQVAAKQMLQAFPDDRGGRGRFAWQLNLPLRPPAKISTADEQPGFDDIWRVVLQGRHRTSQPYLPRLPSAV